MRKFSDVLDRLAKQAEGIIKYQKRFNDLEKQSDTDLMRTDANRRIDFRKDEVYEKLRMMEVNRSKLATNYLGRRSKDREACEIQGWVQVAISRMYRRKMTEVEYDTILSSSPEELTEKIFDSKSFEKENTSLRLVS